MRPVHGMILIPLVTAGCAALFHPKPTPWPLPKVEDAPFRGNWVQSLAVERGEQSLPLLAVIETDGSRLTLAGLTPTGQRLVRITWTDARVEQETDAHLEVPIDGGAILRDVVFANWPQPSLAAVFAGTPWKAAFTGSKRLLSWRGKPWLSVSPGAPAAAGSTSSSGAGADTDAVVVDHLAEGYRVRVTTVERNAP